MKGGGSLNETTDRAAWLEDAMSRCEESLLRMCFAYLGYASEKMWLLRIAINTLKDVRRSAWFRHVDEA